MLPATAGCQQQPCATRCATTEQALRKANPNFGVSVDDEFLKLQQRDAQDDPRKQNVFKTKHLDIWVAAASPWLNLFTLQKAGDSNLTVDQEEWDGSVIGLDLAHQLSKLAAQLQPFNVDDQPVGVGHHEVLGTQGRVGLERDARVVLGRPHPHGHQLGAPGQLSRAQAEDQGALRRRAAGC